MPLPLPSAWLTTRGPGSSGSSSGGGSGAADAHAWGVRVEAADALARWQAIHAPRSGVASLAGSWRGRDLLRQCLLVLPPRAQIRVPRACSNSTSAVKSQPGTPSPSPSLSPCPCPSLRRTLTRTSTLRSKDPCAFLSFYSCAGFVHGRALGRAPAPRQPRRPRHLQRGNRQRRGRGRNVSRRLCVCRPARTRLEPLKNPFAVTPTLTLTC